MSFTIFEGNIFSSKKYNILLDLVSINTFFEKNYYFLWIIRRIFYFCLWLFCFFKIYYIVLWPTISMPRIGTFYQIFISYFKGPFSKDLSQKDLRPKELWYKRTFNQKDLLARGPFPKDLLNQRTFGQKDLFFKGPFVKRTFFQKDLLLKGPFWEVDAKYIVST